MNTTTTEPCMHCGEPVTPDDNYGWFLWADQVELLDGELEPKPDAEEGAMHRECAEQYAPCDIHEV